MPPDTAAYVLLVLDVLVVALVLTLPIVLLLWVLGPLRRTPTARAAPHAAVSANQGGAPAAGDRVLRRCDDCGTGWKAVPGRDRSRTDLKVRRWARRRARARKKEGPGWSKRQGWNRCPSCLSTNVRTSSKHATDA